uniref:Uncharacterized protein n=1 Tax=Magallana gigas TaxID=29159 RepID=K1PUK1_MAGGI
MFSHLALMLSVSFFCLNETSLGEIFSLVTPVLSDQIRHLSCHCEQYGISHNPLIITSDSGHGLSGMGLLTWLSFIAVPAMFAGGIVTAFSMQATGALDTYVTAMGDVS